MWNDKGLTLVEVLLSLFILSILMIVFNSYYYMIHKLIFMDKANQQMGQVAKTKMEELKSNRIYIEGVEYSILELQDEVISFTEDSYKIDIYIEPLSYNTNMHSVNVKVGSNSEDYSYNLIRYIDFHKSSAPYRYEELTIDLH